MQGKGKMIEVYRFATPAEIELKLKKKLKRAKKANKKLMENDDGMSCFCTRIMDKKTRYVLT